MPTLELLKLSFNKIAQITNSFCRVFPNFKILHLDHNKIVRLNNRFGYDPKSVTTLNLCQNQLKHLPYSVTKLQLDNLKVDDVMFVNNNDHLIQIYMDHNENLTMNEFPKLGELACRSILNSA